MKAIEDSTIRKAIQGVASLYKAFGPSTVVTASTLARSTDITIRTCRAIWEHYGIGKYAVASELLQFLLDDLHSRIILSTRYVSMGIEALNHDIYRVSLN